MRRICVIAFFCSLLFWQANAQTVVARVSFSNRVEASTYIPTGPYASSVAYIEGYDVKAIPGMGKSQLTDKELFSTLGLPIRNMARGIAYLEAERRFVFTDNGDPASLYLTDERGRLQEHLHVTWPDGQPLPNFVEGVVWVGANEANFANHFLLVVNFSDSPSRIATITRDGTVDGLIAPSVDIGYATGLAYLAPDRLLLTDIDNTLMLVMDIHGNVQRTVDTGPIIVEGITPLPNGNIALFPGTSGQMLVFNADFQPIPALTRSFVVGANLYPCTGVAWNTDAAEFVGSCAKADFTASALWNIALDGNAATALVAYDPNLGLPPYRFPTFLPDKHLIATVHTPAPRGIQFYTTTGQDAGSYQIQYGPQETYIPSTGQIVGKFGTAGLVFFDALTGANPQFLDLSGMGVTSIAAIAYFEDNGGEKLLVFDFASELAFVLKLDGTLVSSFNYVTTMGVLRPNSAARIDSGPYAGDLMVFEPDPSRVTIFHLN